MYIVNDSKYPVAVAEKNLFLYFPRKCFLNCFLINQFLDLWSQRRY